MTPGEPSSISSSLISSLFPNKYKDLGSRDLEPGAAFVSSRSMGYFQPNGRAGVEATTC